MVFSDFFRLADLWFAVFNCTRLCKFFDQLDYEHGHRSFALRAKLLPKLHYEICDHDGCWRFGGGLMSVRPLRHFLASGSKIQSLSTGSKLWSVFVVKLIEELIQVCAIEY